MIELSLKNFPKLYRDKKNLSILAHHIKES